MERIKVKSSKIEEVGYDREKKILEVKYKNKQLFKFKEVPSNFWSELMLAPSIGKYFFDNIKDTFPYDFSIEDNTEEEETEEEE